MIWYLTHAIVPVLSWVCDVCGSSMEVVDMILPCFKLHGIYLSLSHSVLTWTWCPPFWCFQLSSYLSLFKLQVTCSKLYLQSRICDDPVVERCPCFCLRLVCVSLIVSFAHGIKSSIALRNGDFISSPKVWNISDTTLQTLCRSARLFQAMRMSAHWCHGRFPGHQFSNSFHFEASVPLVPSVILSTSSQDEQSKSPRSYQYELCSLKAQKSSPRHTNFQTARELRESLKFMILCQVRYYCCVHV